MEINKNVLDAFGKLVVNNVYDDGINYFKQLKNNQTKWGTGKEYTDVFNKLNEIDKLTLQKYVDETIRATIFGFLGVFEENENFKIIYQENSELINLVEISEMLKSEPNGENGWIARFSKEIDKDQIL